MFRVLPIALFLAAPFWESKAPADWTTEELIEIMRASPWAQSAGGAANAVSAQVYLATARIMRQAEDEWARRNRKRGANLESDPLREEYEAFLKENVGKVIVLAVPIGDPRGMMDAEEVHRMEKECVLKVGRKKFKLAGHFPPTPADPYLRLAFPRELPADAKRLQFELYIPGLSQPARIAEFEVKMLKFKGEPDF